MLKNFSKLLREHPELLDEIFAEVNQLRKDLASHQKSFPSEGEPFFFADSICGAVTQAIWSKDSTRNLWLEQTGNCFPDIQSAKKHLAHLMAAEEFRSMGRPFTAGEHNWQAVYFPSNRAVRAVYASIGNDGTFFPSLKACEDAIKAIGGKEVFIERVLGIKN